MTFTFTALPAPDADDLLFMQGFIADLAITKVAILTYSAEVIDTMSKHVKSILILFVILWGFAVMRGAVDHPGPDTFLRFLKIVTVVMLSMGAGSNVIVIADFFWNIPDEMVQSFTPVLSSSIFSWLSDILRGWGTITVELLVVGVMSQIASFAQEMASPGASFTELAASAGLYVVGGGLSGMVLATIMVCRISLAILLALAPLFIVSILFEKTKSFFDSWLNAVLTFMLTLVLLSLTVFLFFPILLKTIAVYYLFSLAQGDVLTTKQGFQLMVVLGIYMAVIKQVPSTAASIARGYAANVSGRWDQWDGMMGGRSRQADPTESARQIGRN